MGKDHLKLKWFQLSMYNRWTDYEFISKSKISAAVCTDLKTRALHLPFIRLQQA